jgi:hypothetical protein
LKKFLVAVIAGSALLPALNLAVSTPAYAQAASASAGQSAVLSTVDAQRVAAEMGMSLDSAVSQGLMAPSAPGASTYVVTQSGASALGVSTSITAGLSTLQITAIVVAVVANVVGLGVVVFDDSPAPVADAPPTTTTTTTP